MVKNFKTIHGEVVDVVNHTLEIMKKYPNVEIHIGTDSQNKRRKTIYVTVIAYRYGMRGVHYILHKQKVKRIRDMWTRLWKETDMSIEVAEWLTQKINVNVEIDMDYNIKDEFESHKLIPACEGWAKSLGYKVNVKPTSQIATHAADKHAQT